MPSFDPNPIILGVFKRLEQANIRHCHFKSNNNLARALCGDDDVDLLVEAVAKLKLIQILSDFGFIQGMETNHKANPYIYHYYCFDPKTEKILHLHVYYRLVTGGSIIKPLLIPVKDLLLDNTHRELGVLIPIKEADFIVFVIRKIVEQSAFWEQFLYQRDLENIQSEYLWLTDNLDQAKLLALLKQYFSWLSLESFNRLASCIDENPPGYIRFFYGINLRRKLRLRTKNLLTLFYYRNKFFVETVLRSKLRKVRRFRCLYPGGVFIAFVGSEGSGKSTLSSAIADKLSVDFDVIHDHLGKPKKSLLTLLPWTLIAIYGKCKRYFKHATTTQTQTVPVARANFEPRPLVAILIAMDRLKRVTQLQRAMIKGHTIITDRYPNAEFASIDGPTIQASSSNRLTNWLASLERKLYNNIPPPDYVFQTEVSLETALKRNQARAKPEPDQWVRYRFEKLASLHALSGEYHVISTSQPLNASVREVLAAVFRTSQRKQKIFDEKTQQVARFKDEFH